MARLPHDRMDLDDYRRAGHRMVDWIAEYRGGAGDHPVMARVEPGAVFDALPSEAPEDPETIDAILADVDSIVVPGLSHWQSPNWFAYFPANAAEASLLGDMLSTGLGVQGMLWSTSPACTEVEMRMLDWTARALGLPDAFRFDVDGPGGGVLQDTASSAVLACMIAARDRATGGRSGTHGLDQSTAPLVAYTSSQSHSSLEKAARLCGIGTDHLRLIEVDEAFAMRPDAFAARLHADLDAGAKPFFVNVTLGTTASGGFDPLPEIGRLAREHGLWVHVDAAMMGTAALCEEFRGMHAGIEHADSWNFNPHKWMGAAFDCSCLWLRETESLVSAMSIMPEYLRNRATDSGRVIDYRDWQIPLGRRFRALKLWFLYRGIGLVALRTMVREHVRLATELEAWLDAEPRLESAAPRSLNMVCFRHVAGDDATRAMLHALNDSGDMSLTHCELDGRFVIRCCIGQWRTTMEHVRTAWDRIRLAAGAVE
ncbi:MAG: pyridoxal-dependent decarboxylase [Planctomycetota bacterium]|nr:pyridoxal-dependent decarboxylase [Planctomycetota bacterium]